MRPNFDIEHYRVCARNLKQEHPHLSCSEIAKLTGISKTTAAKYLTGLIPPGKTCRRWTDSEIAILETGAEIIPAAAIAKKLKRSEKAVYVKAKLLGLSLRCTIDNYSANYLAHNLKISPIRVSRWIKQGLLKATKTPKQWTINSAAFAEFCWKHPEEVARCDASIIDWLSGGKSDDSPGGAVPVGRGNGVQDA